MGMNRMRQLLFVCLTFFMVNATAQIKMEAAASKSTLPLHDKLRVDFTVNADGDNFVPPDFEESGFSVFSGPIQSIRELWEMVMAHLIKPTRIYWFLKKKEH